MVDGISPLETMEHGVPRRLPRGCVEDRDRHGNVRIYYRAPGLKKVRLRGTPWSSAFMEAYERATKGEDADAPGLARSRQGTWRWLCEQYLARSPQFLQMEPATRAAYRRILEATYDEPVKPGDRRLFRDVPLEQMGTRALNALIVRKIETPAAANAILKVARQVFEFGVQDEIVASNPTLKIAPLTAETGGHHTWTIEEARRFEDRHPIGSQARLAYALLLYTGARISDVVQFGRQHVSEGWLHFKPGKTRKSSSVEVDIPILPELQAVLDASKTGNLTYLITHQHRPYSAKGLSNRMRDWCDEAELPQCSGHGLRKAGATIAAENGATEAQLMAIYGWTSPKQAARYTQKARRKKMAGDAMGLIKVG